MAQRIVMRYYSDMAEIGQRLSPSDRARLEEWEREHIGGNVGTSDWPGWSEYGLKRPFWWD
jgi:hypothetical protein